MRGHDTGLDYHRMMLGDLTKMNAYSRAIAEVVRPGDVVLDVGCGTGVLAMLAARAGASRVYAVESMPVAELARELVVANGLEGVVQVHRADLVGLEPIEPVDRVIGDWIGRFLVDDDMFDAVHAATAWLKPTGTLHPDAVELFLAPVGDFPVPMVEGFDHSAHGLDLRPARARALNSCYLARLSIDQVLGPAQSLVRWRCAEPLPAIGATLDFEVQRAGLLKGVAGWFQAQLSPSVRLSSSPEHDTHWGQYLFPMEPRQVAVGERFSLAVRWDGHTWTWGGQCSEWTQECAPVVPRPKGDPAALSDAGTVAFHDGDLARAEALYSEACASLPGWQGDAGSIWENLGLARMNAGAYEAAAGAFMEALAHGDRQQSLRFVVVCLAHSGRSNDARRWLERYTEVYGAHPDLAGS